MLFGASQFLDLIEDQEQIFQARIVDFPVALAHAYLRRLIGVHGKLDPGERAISRLRRTEPAVDDDLGVLFECGARSFIRVYEGDRRIISSIHHRFIADWYVKPKYK